MGYGSKGGVTPSELHSKAPVNTFNDLPVSGNFENDIRAVKDTDRLYIWTIVASSGDISNWQNIVGLTISNLDDISNGFTYGKVKISELSDGKVAHLALLRNLVAPSQPDFSESVAGFYGATYEAQSFIADKTGTLDSVEIVIDRNTENLVSYEDAEMTIRTVDENGKPTSTVLGTVIIAKANIPSYDAGTSVTFTFSGVNVIAGTSYVFVLRQVNDGGDGTNSYNSYGRGSNVYSHGSYIYSLDSGTSWIITINKELNFIIIITGTLGDEIISFIEDGQLQTDLDANSKSIINLKAPSANGGAIRQTTKITESNVEDSIDKKHTQNTDIKLNEGGANEVIVVDVKDAVIKKHNHANQSALDTIDAQLNQTIQTLTDETSIIWDASIGGFAIVTLGGNRTLSNPTNVIVGSTYRLIVKQDATGSRTLGYGTNFKFPGNIEPTLTSVSGATDILEFIAESSSILHLVNFIADLK